MESHDSLARKLTELEHNLENHDEQIQAIFEAIRQLIAPPDKKGKKKIGFIAKEKQAGYGKKEKSVKRL